MTNIKTIFIDIDDNKNISLLNDKMLIKLKEQDIKIILVTKESTNKAYLINKKYNIADYLITLDGSITFDYSNKKVLKNNYIDQDTIKKIFDYAKDKDLTFIIDTLNKSITNNKEYQTTHQDLLYQDNISNLVNSHINKITILSSNYNRMLVIPRLFQDKYPSIKIISSSDSITKENYKRENYYYHEIIATHISKNKAITDLLEYLHIKEDNSIYIGQNDYTYDLINNILIKSNITYIAKTEDSDTIYKSLEELISR